MAAAITAALMGGGTTPRQMIAARVEWAGTMHRRGGTGDAKNEELGML
jgi:hypothetical protein